LPKFVFFKWLHKFCKLPQTSFILPCLKYRTQAFKCRVPSFILTSGTISSAFWSLAKFCQILGYLAYVSRYGHFRGISAKSWLFQVTSQGLQITAYYFRFSTIEVWDISFQMTCSNLYFHTWNDFYGFLKFDKILPNFGIFGICVHMWLFEAIFSQKLFFSSDFTSFASYRKLLSFSHAWSIGHKLSNAVFQAAFWLLEQFPRHFEVRKNFAKFWDFWHMCPSLGILGQFQPKVGSFKWLHKVCKLLYTTFVFLRLKYGI